MEPVPFTFRTMSLKELIFDDSNHTKHCLSPLMERESELVSLCYMLYIAGDKLINTPSVLAHNFVKLTYINMQPSVHIGFGNIQLSCEFLLCCSVFEWNELHCCVDVLHETLRVSFSFIFPGSNFQRNN